MENQKVKPRFDGKGSEFGLIHRELPVQCGMFDIDRMTASATIELELKKQDVAYFEYRTNLYKKTIKWTALFEIKYKDSQYVQDAISCRVGTATWAQLRLCEELGARYFIVIANNGIQPLDFYEIDYDGTKNYIGTLDYIDRKTDGKAAINNFWRDVLKLIP